MKNIVVFGASGHAAVVIDALEKQGQYHIVGLIDQAHRQDEVYAGYKVIGNEKDLPQLVKQYCIEGGLIGIGDNYVRYKLVQKIYTVVPTFNFVCAIHPSAQLARGVVIEEGTAVMANAVINAKVQVGKHGIVNTKASIDHHSVLGNFASVAPGVTVGGSTNIGAFSAVGLGANIIHNVSIGEHTVIGAGALVLQSIPNYVVAYGQPCRVVRNRTLGEKYL